jgi:hypothetical protein
VKEPKFLDLNHAIASYKRLDFANERNLKEKLELDTDLQRLHVENIELERKIQAQVNKSRRDRFAAEALNSIAGIFVEIEGAEKIAEIAVLIADALIKELDKKES